MTDASETFWSAFMNAYLALETEKDYFYRLAKTSVLEKDKINLFRQALAMQNTLASMESANKAVIDALSITPLKGPTHTILEKAQTLSTEFAQQIAKSAKAETIVGLAGKFLDAWRSLGKT